MKKPKVRKVRKCVGRVVGGMIIVLMFALFAIDPEPGPFWGTS